MYLLILLWTALGGMTSFPERLLLLLDWPSAYSDTITPAYTYPVVQSNSSHTKVEHVDTNTDCASSLIKFCI